MASSWDEELCASTKLRAQLTQIEKIYGGQRTKLQGELHHMRGQRRLLRDEIANCGLSIAGLVQKLAALSIQPTNIFNKPVTKDPKAGD